MARGLTEELAVRFYRMKGYFVECDVPFKMRKGPARKVGGWSDIDYLAFNGHELVIGQCKSQLVTASAQAITKDLRAWFQEASAFARGPGSPFDHVAGHLPLRKEVITWLHYAGSANRVSGIRKDLAADGIRLVDAADVLAKMLRLTRDNLDELSKETPGAYGRELDPMLDLIRYFVYSGWIKEERYAKRP
jgi:hypothetical protein